MLPTNLAGEIRKQIRSAFPAEPFAGEITPGAGNSSEIDDSHALYEAFHKKRWNEVPTAVLDAEPNLFVLFTDAAFGAFFAAWLTRALDEAKDEIAVREFLLYTTSGYPSQALRQVRTLNLEQRGVLRSLLQALAEYEGSDYLRDLAGKAVANLDSL